MEAVAQLGDLGGGQVGKHVHRAALQAQEDAVRILDDLIGDFGQLRLFAPVIVKPLQHHGFLGRPGDELEGAGAHRLGVLLGVVLGQDGGGKVGGKLVAGLLEFEADGVISLRIHLHPGKGRHLDDVGAVRLGAPLVGPDNVLRRHVLAVVELHAGAELEGIKQMVVGNRVALCHGGIQVAAGVGFQKAFKYVEHDLAGSCLHGFVRVKTAVQVLGDAHVQFARRSPGFRAVGCRVGALVRVLGGSRLAAASASAEYGAQEADSRQKRQDLLFHMQFSFLYHCSGESVYLRRGPPPAPHILRAGRL